MADWVKSRDADLSEQGEQMSSYISANAVALGLVAGDATALASNLASFQEKLEAA